MSSSDSKPKHAGGRPSLFAGGMKSHNNDGLSKSCPCPHRQWSKCKHAWHFNFKYDGINHRFSLYKHFQKPRGYMMSRHEAEGLRDNIRAQIRAGKFNTGSPTTTTADGQRTLRDVAALYHEHCSADPNRRKHRLPILKKALAVICRTVIDGQPFGDKPIEAIIAPDLEKFRGARRAKFRAAEAQLKERRAKIAADDTDARALPVPSELPHAKRGEIGINRSLELLRALLNWSGDNGYRDAVSPFAAKKHGRPTFKFTDEQGRERRLMPGEEERFRQHAGLHLLALFIVAVEAGLRREEALSLQWKHILQNAKGQPRALMLQPDNTKEAKPRTVPVSMALRAVLEMRRNGPDGEPLGPEAFVFGNEVGERQDSIKTAWNATLRRAKIQDLHYQDLRHEAASRWLDNGVPLLSVSYLLGHAKISTTDTYVQASPVVAERELLAAQRRRERATRAVKPTATSKPSAIRVH